MASLDTVSIAILLGSLLVLAGILSSLVALRFGAPLLLVFLLVGMLAGEGGPGGIKFDDVGTAYTVGSIALALILFDGGLRTRLATFRNVLAPAVTLATVGVLITTLLTAPVAKFVLGIGWIAGAAGRRGGCLDRRGGGVLPDQCRRPAAAPARARDARSRIRHQRSVRGVPDAAAGRDPAARRPELVACARHVRCAIRVLGCVIGCAGGRVITLVLNRLTLAQGLHAPFVAVGALVVFAFANARACLRLSRGLSRRAGGRQPADARAQFGRRVSRRRHLAGADRDVRAARPAGLAAAAGRQPARRDRRSRWR